MISFPSFILIDDKEKELEEIHLSFIASGFPCLPILYKSEPGNESGIDHANIESIIPRVVITDLNLEEQKIDAPGLVGPIAKVLKKLCIRGPYLLFFWSKNESKVDEVMKLLESRRSFDDIQLPLYHGIISKSELQGDNARLQERIKGLINENPTFNALLDWEDRVGKAARETTNSLYNITAPATRENYQENHTKELANTLAAIGNETLGVKNAKDNPNTSIDMGLAPVLIDRLMTMKPDQDLWKIAVPNIGGKTDINCDVKYHLNSFYHVEEIPENYPKDNKGVFVELSNSILNDYDKKTKLEKKLGRKIDQIILDEFISNIKLDGKSRAEMRLLRTEAIENIRLGFIELSADCDQAQKKVRLHKYILSALIPIKYERITVFEDNGVKRPQSHEGIYRAPIIKVGGKIYILKISFKYQIGTLPITNINNDEYINTWLTTPVFRLKEQILGDISFKCAQYSTRPGIVSFR